MIVVKRPRDGRRPGVVERDAGGLAVSAGAVMLEAPNPKLQAPEKFQTPNTEIQMCSSRRKEALTDLGAEMEENIEPPYVGCYARQELLQPLVLFEAWNLGLPWSLRFGAWSFYSLAL
jgi:hypothetical protein